ncbi:hypothetical protein P154DRAFT_468550 [Amniculicola lignicola CBS 123094]|uniref:BZIP domain-containing protein n=1 Tax=Amniculicola lignicola CBS 123094 TaxID=1392246 RepID=A0A6A5WCI4_9PLEO|nr:hypothetical protein P154DRAFT_468550 [Amniculicola lignicola CBS 123094]
MSRLYQQNSSGAPTFTAASASLNLSGLERTAFSPLLTSSSSTMLDHPEWFHDSGDHSFGGLSPQHEHFPAPYGNGFASHGIPVTLEGMHQEPHYPSLTPMNGFQHPHDHGIQPLPRVDDLGAISPIQTTYGPYATPYPDSTASSAPSEDPINIEADEDKRKRNQAASARFRQKKKQREQQMLEQSREMVNHTKKLEGEVAELKRENTFLKRLLVEKVDNLNDDDKALLTKTTSANQKDEQG